MTFLSISYIVGVLGYGMIAGLEFVYPFHHLGFTGHLFNTVFSILQLILKFTLVIAMFKRMKSSAGPHDEEGKEMKENQLLMKPLLPSEIIARKGSS